MYITLPSCTDIPTVVERLQERGGPLDVSKELRKFCRSTSVASALVARKVRGGRSSLKGTRAPKAHDVEMRTIRASPGWKNGSARCAMPIALDDARHPRALKKGAVHSHRTGCDAVPDGVQFPQVAEPG